jgi:Phytanoyl-CoA dioxygenase (PhyH)
LKNVSSSGNLGRTEASFWRFSDWIISISAESRRTVKVFANSMTHMYNDTFKLSHEEIVAFYENGYLSPLTLCPPNEMADIRKRISEDVFSGQLPPHGVMVQSRHLDVRSVWELCSHPAIVDRISCLLGSDLILWRSNFFTKTPHDKEVPWHQDINYWPIEPQVNISAWLAIDSATKENSCMQVIPGSHKKTLQHIPGAEHHAFPEQTDPRAFETDKAVDLELQPGQFFLFTERLLHHSDAPRSDKPRTALAIRVTVPFVRVDHASIFAGHKNIVLRGVDRMGFNELAEPPR